jgi:uncharacterized protein with von Willebrand factor type A (vWA) domain
MYNQNKDLFDNMYKEINGPLPSQNNTQSSPFDFSNLMQTTKNFINENPEIANQLKDSVTNMLDSNTIAELQSVADTIDYNNPADFSNFANILKPKRTKPAKIVWTDN